MTQFLYGICCYKFAITTLNIKEIYLDPTGLLFFQTSLINAQTDDKHTHKVNNLGGELLKMTKASFQDHLSEIGFKRCKRESLHPISSTLSLALESLHSSTCFPAELNSVFRSSAFKSMLYKSFLIMLRRVLTKEITKLVLATGEVSWLWLERGVEYSSLLQMQSICRSDDMMHAMKT
jgi:hypothetical protein